MKKMMIFAFIMAPMPASAEEFAKGEFTDPRDTQTYPTVKIGGLEWFARNLNYAAPGSFCYDGDQANCDTDGRLYRWEGSLAACPAGWHSSTDFEWQKLELALGMDFELLETVNDRGTDQGDQLAPGGRTGFDYQLAGYRDPAGVYDSQDEGAAIWHTNEADYITAWHRDLRPSRSGSWRSRVNKEYALSVRCVRNTFDKDVADWDF